MAHVLSLENDTVSLDLADTSDVGYHMVTFRPPRPNRALSRVSAYPHGDGQRTTASALLDSTVEILVHIIGLNVDDVEGRLQDLVTLLEDAQRYEVTRDGSPVRLTWKRQGATNTAYRVITGVPGLPEPVDDEGDWLDLSTVTNDLLVSFVVTLEPTWHAGALTTLIDNEILTVVPGGNHFEALDDVDGTMPASLAVTATNSGTLDWDQVWLAELAGTPDVQDLGTGIVVAGAYGGFVNSYIATGSALSIASLDFPMADKYRHPLRCFLRGRVTAGDATKLQLQFVVRFGGETWLTTPYQTWSGFASGFSLVDLGQLHARGLFNRVAQSDAASEISYLVNFKSADGSNVDFDVDYFEVIPIRSLVRLSGMDAQATFKLAYEDLARDDTFYWPRRATQSYSTLNTDALYLPAERYGRLSGLRPNSVPRFWVNVQSATEHHLTTANVTLLVRYLPAYALGLRGAA